MATWKDATSYSKGGDRIPTSWATEVGGMTIVVVSRHRYAPDRWVMHCHALNYDTYDLGLRSDEPAEEAQRRAFEIIRGRVFDLYRAFSEGS